MSRMFLNTKEMYPEVMRDLKEMGITYTSDTVQDQKGSFKTLELNNYCLTILNPTWEEAYNTAGEHGINLPWLKAEAQDRNNFNLDQKNPNPAVNLNIGFWGKFIRDGALAYSYPERLHPQIERVIYELKTRPNTRQAILTMYDWHQDLMNAGGRDRIPCTMHYQFLLRGGELHCSYVMRSCDLIKFFLADIALGIALTSNLASLLGVKMGNFTHFTGSLHAFADDLKEVF